ncbi:hypothetical protein D3C75_916020 [compost metagenome]
MGPCGAVGCVRFKPVNIGDGSEKRNGAGFFDTVDIYICLVCSRIGNNPEAVPGVGGIAALERHIGAIRIAVRETAADGFDGYRRRCAAEQPEYLGVVNERRLHELEGGLHLAGLGGEGCLQAGQGCGAGVIQEHTAVG